VSPRDVIRQVLDGERPPYVPWSFGLTGDAERKLREHFGADDLSAILQNHLLKLGSDIGFFEDLGDNRVRDVFGVVWDRSTDRDIGIPEGRLLSGATLKGYSFPDPRAPRFFAEIPERIARWPQRFRLFQVGFSLYERAWTLRGMQTLLMDFYDHPHFVDDLFNAIADYNIAQVTEALRYDIDAVYFGDDWGQQRGLQMGPGHWRRFLLPVLRRMVAVVREAGKYVFIHSCGDVDELFDDLVSIGVSCFNPFQPEVMDVAELIGRYRGRLAFHGGLSVQRTLPQGTPEDVRRETKRLLDLGRDGGLIFSPSHDVPRDVPLENMLAFIDLVLNQPEAIRGNRS
jgi:uroporphyrinogen decarboxylase